MRKILILQKKEERDMEKREDGVVGLIRLEEEFGRRVVPRLDGLGLENVAFFFVEVV